MADDVIDCGPCRLRPWRPDDAEALARHADDAEVSRALGDRFPWPYSLDDARAFLAMAVQRPGEIMAIEIDAAPVGGIGLQRGEDVHRLDAKMGYWLARRYWGRGIMSAALEGFSRYAFATFDFARLHAHVYVNNPASARVLEKCGYQREGLLRRAAVKRGELLDLWLYARLRD